MYVPNKTVNRGNFSKYIDRVYTIIRDSRVGVAFVFGSMCAAPAAEKAFKYEAFLS